MERRVEMGWFPVLLAQNSTDVGLKDSNDATLVNLPTMTTASLGFSLLVSNDCF